MTNRKNQQNVASTPLSWEPLKKNALAHVVLGMQENVLVTHEHLRKLRQCVEHIQGKKDRKLYVVAQRNNPQVKFLIKTLLHLGVSCGQINCLIDASNCLNIEIFVSA